LQLHRTLKLVIGRIEVAAPQINSTQVANRRRITWIYFQGRGNQALRFFESPVLQGNDTEQMRCVKLTRRLRDDLFVDLGSLSRVTGLMQRNSLSQQWMAGGLLGWPLRRSATHLNRPLDDFMPYFLRVGTEE
jgi:hypothetical protein